MTATVTQLHDKTGNPGTPDQRLAALAAVFSPPLTVEQLGNLGKYEPVFASMARALLDATWAASQ